jgi:tRNA (adenine22-N1)-methyltransferase
MKEKNISPRLLSAADFVRQDAILADIGTDHAYLPLFLLKEGRISRAYCSDINEGPLASARANAEAAGLSDRIEFTLADGADALSGKGITDYTICGMGGELIADIIERAPEMRSSEVRLILQPMTRRGELVKYLYSHGFEVEREAYSKDAGKFYVALIVGFSGECRELSELEAEFGLSATPCQNPEAKIGYLKAKRQVFKKRVIGVEKSKCGGVDYSAHLAYIDEMIKEAEAKKL